MDLHATLTNQKQAHSYIRAAKGVLIKNFGLCYGYFVFFYLQKIRKIWVGANFVLPL